MVSLSFSQTLNEHLPTCIRQTSLATSSIVQAVRDYHIARNEADLVLHFSKITPTRDVSSHCIDVTPLSDDLLSISADSELKASVKIEEPVNVLFVDL